MATLSCFVHIYRSGTFSTRGRSCRFPSCLRVDLCIAQLAAKATASSYGQHEAFLSEVNNPSPVIWPRFLGHQLGFISRKTLPVVDSLRLTCDLADANLTFFPAFKEFITTKAARNSGSIVRYSLTRTGAVQMVCGVTSNELTRKSLLS